MNILVIKLGALGDFIQSLTFMKAIRDHHPEASITLLTTQMFMKFGQDCGYCDQVILDPRAKWFEPSKWRAFRKSLRHKTFERIYDLQNNHRTRLYHDLFFKSQETQWIGETKKLFGNHTASQHAFDRHKETLASVGITNITMDTLAWMKADVSEFDLKKPYVLLVPGCAPTRPEKRWPAAHYTAVAKHLAAKNIQPIIIGTQDEADVTKNIAANCDAALDLTGQTSLAQIATLARASAGAIGNDTGPMHLIGATGTPCLVLFSAASDPRIHAPRGGGVNILEKGNLDDLLPETVIKHFQPRT